MKYHSVSAIFEKKLFPFFQTSRNPLSIGVTAETSSFIVVSGIFQLKCRWTGSLGKAERLKEETTLNCIEYIWKQAVLWSGI